MIFVSFSDVLMFRCAYSSMSTSELSYVRISLFSSKLHASFLMFIFEHVFAELSYASFDISLFVYACFFDVQTPTCLC